jgi:1,4-alpha-glucan branching enzyme
MEGKRTEAKEGMRDYDGQPQDAPKTPSPGLPPWARTAVAAILASVAGTVGTLQFLGQEFTPRKEFAVYVETQRKLETATEAATTRSDLTTHVNTGHPDTAAQLSRINERLAAIETNVQWLVSSQRRQPRTTQ